MGADERQTEGSAESHTPQDFEAFARAACVPLPSGYRRRDPEATVLHEAVRESLATFLAESAENGGGQS